MNEAPMFELSSADRVPRRQVGVFYETLSPTDTSQLARAFIDRARASHADARSDSVSSGTRVGASYARCAFITLWSLAERGILFEGAPEALESLVACLLRPYENRVGGFMAVVERHLRRFDTPLDCTDKDVELVCEVAGAMLRDVFNVETDK